MWYARPLDVMLQQHVVPETKHPSLITKQHQTNRNCGHATNTSLAPLKTDGHEKPGEPEKLPG